MPKTKARDPSRGIDPERIDEFSRTLDRTTGEMFSLARKDQPIRGAKLARLAELTRLLVHQAARFSEEVEAIL
jgi:hypothetical protein